MHGARLVRKDAEFCRQPRKESKSALCRLPQCSLRCQIPAAGVFPGVRQEAQAQPIGRRVLSVASGRESHYTALPQACPPQSASSPLYSPSPACFLQAATHDPAAAAYLFIGRPLLDFGHPPLCTLAVSPSHSSDATGFSFPLFAHYLPLE